MFILFMLVFSCQAENIFEGHQYNGTHVRINNRTYLVVNCEYKNDSKIDSVNFTVPEINYRNISNIQSLFLHESDNRYARYSCSNSNVTCDCSIDWKSAIGYKCNCPYKTSGVKKYFNESSRRFVNKCETFETLCNKCHPRNTAKCSIANKTEVRCTCITGYDSSTMCYQLFNACNNPPEGSSLSGNSACLIRDKNVCIPFLGYQKYLCQCFYPSKENGNLGFPNCMGKKMVRCDSILCINGGVCDPTPGERCICKKGFSGRYCEIVHYRYTGLWALWSSCYPDCGNFGVRSSESVCDGPSSIFCSGVIRKWERCAAISCDLKFLSRIENKTIQGLRFELAKMLSLTPNESSALFLIIILGGLTTGLIYIFMIELIRWT